MIESGYNGFFEIIKYWRFWDLERLVVTFMVGDDVCKLVKVAWIKLKYIFIIIKNYSNKIIKSICYCSSIYK